MLQGSRPLGEPAKGGGLQVGVGQLRQPTAALGDLHTLGGWSGALSADHHRSYMLSSNSVVGRRMAVSLGVELSNRFVDGAVEVIRTVERLMSEVMPLQVAPDRFNVVELWGVVRQPLDGEPVGALGERGA